MKVVIAEKPSVARDIAAVLGARTRKDGYFEGNGYAVTYAFGHLARIAEPEQMDARWGSPWRLDALPMVPLEWKYCVADGARQQFAVIKRLFLDRETTKIICATDAGREGEHIFRLIYRLTGAKKPVERLWISSLTQDAIQDGFRKLRPGRDFDNLAQAASARAQADWLVGLNFTRAYTVASRQLCTIGRVQTPTLALLVERQKEIESFRPETFFEIAATLEPGFLATYVSGGPEGETRLPDRARAQEIYESIIPVTHAVVQSVKTAEKRTNAPALYDLLTLQKDANKRFGFTAQKTLDLAQNLYEEQKLISYPRTESRHISTDMADELPALLSAVLASSPQDTRDVFCRQGLVPGKITVEQLISRLGKAYIDDTKLTDHHAIIPTGRTARPDLPEAQAKIYELIALRFMSIFLPPERRDETIAHLSIGPHTFRARGVVIKDLGWRILHSRAPEGAGKGDETQTLPPLAAGQQVRKLAQELKEGKTTPPKPFDDASLLSAMKNAGREIDDEDLAAYMKQSGLGTPATRAAIIERLLQSGYIERQKKILLPTEKGKSLIAHVHADLKDVKLTASWEQELARVQEGKTSAREFETRIVELVKRILPDVTRCARKIDRSSNPESAIPATARGSRSTEGEPGHGDGKARMPSGGMGACPQCRLGVVRETPRGAGCSRWREGCKFTIWRELYGKKLTDKQIESLVRSGETRKLKGFKKRDGSGTFAAKLCLAPDFKVRLCFDT